ncbi:MAG TPA: glycosyltransferase family 39 protein, partial [Gemmatimonadales bacterium]|nr:glycosyltransferase family 39 protein [Gemmatimonadales bacterium]
MPESAVVDEPKVFGGLRGRDLLVLGVLALALRLVHLNHTPHYDEFFHVLAAQSWLRDHDFCIAQCRQPYTRGLLFTWLVIGAFKLGGISLVVARIPAVLAGTMWVLAVAAWTGRVGGRSAGWLAGVLMLLDPGVLYLSQLARFYGLHALLFWLGAAALYFALTPGTGGRRRLGWLVACAVALLLAFSLQVTTLIGVAALALWAVLDQWRRIFDLLRHSRIAQVAAAIIIVIGVAVLIEFWISGKLAGLWRTYRWSTLWTRSEADNPKYFFNFFLEQYGWLWSLLPIAGLVALWSR